MLNPKTHIEHGTQPHITCRSQNTSYTGKRTYPCNTYKVTKYILHWKRGPIYVIRVGHKIHCTLKKGDPSMQHLHIKYNIHWKREFIYAIHAYQMNPILEKGAHQCNTCISNATYIEKGNPSMKYLHVK